MLIFLSNEKGPGMLHFYKIDRSMITVYFKKMQAIIKKYTTKSFFPIIVSFIAFGESNSTIILPFYYYIRLIVIYHLLVIIYV